ncbi:MAG TPA: SpoIIE family protein phosphatase [Pseudonocardiaceae bacterium]|jgi:serine phosphatase RsbU (regulator of sigma subunit)/anti-sigma regulatory factor (Ser/Thr protein kinase)
MNTEHHEFHWDGPADRDVIGEVRRTIQGWGAQTGLPDDLVAELTLASYEAMANVVEHAYPDHTDGPLDIRITRENNHLIVTVTDQGHWRSAAADDLRGRGLLLMEGMAKQLRVTRSTTGTTVEMRWPITPNQPETARTPQHAEDGREDAADRLRDMAAITDTALARLDTDAMTQETLTRVRELLGADTATVLVHDPSSEHLIATASAGIEQEVRQGIRIPYGHGFAGTVAANQKPMIVDHVDATTVLNPLLWEAGLHTLLGVPMVAAGQVVGVLHVGSRAQRTFTEHDISLLQLAADRLALATQAQLSRAEHAAANALQRSLLPSRLPNVPGFEFAARYVPSATSGVGGDWYDVFQLDDNRIGIVIGDVSGHGLASAVVMGRLRSALRAYALDNDSPGVVLDKLDRKAHHFEAGVMATVAYGVIDLDQNRLRFCLAGHLPPVLAVPGKASVFVDGPPDPPIGFDLRTRQRRCHTVDLPPGSSICFYTDGLIERRGRPLDLGMQALLRLVSANRSEATCATLMARFVGTASLPDDVAVLIAHRTVP